MSKETKAEVERLKDEAVRADAKVWLAETDGKPEAEIARLRSESRKASMIARKAEIALLRTEAGEEIQKQQRIRELLEVARSRLKLRLEVLDETKTQILFLEQTIDGLGRQLTESEITEELLEKKMEKSGEEEEKHE